MRLATSAIYLLGLAAAKAQKRQANNKNVSVEYGSFRNAADICDDTSWNDETIPDKSPTISDCERLRLDMENDRRTRNMMFRVKKGGFDQSNLSVVAVTSYGTCTFAFSPNPGSHINWDFSKFSVGAGDIAGILNTTIHEHDHNGRTGTSGVMRCHDKSKGHGDSDIFWKVYNPETEVHGH
ncbi:hypothetical protein PG999_009923 [Apiospora kogelbergensis]|uniref:Ecp2 effector protein-like domain-containing protein n=1 Tax=Apiospora kogelbergensis TaxID=1337665 RepID=A0AAW0QM93_9PEZI